MSSYSTIAVAGAGNLGAPIIDALLKEKAAGKLKDVAVLTRSSSKNSKTEEFAKKGASIIPVDYNDSTSLAKSLSGLDVVISTFGLDALDAQQALALGSKAAGVKLFVPSEFGNATDSPQQGPMAHKVALQEKLKEIGLPYVLIFNGPLIEICVNAHLGMDMRNGKGLAGGDGNTPISWTSIADVASFLAHVLTTLPPSELEWRTFRIQGERSSMNEIYKKWEAKTGQKVEVTYKSLPELQEAMKNPADFASLLHFLWAIGQGSVGEPVSNDVWPEWHPKTILDIVAP